MTTKAMHTADPDDAGLVAEILDGNREAFRKIVERYQTLISSIAYCATGNMSQSEDLAQETFVTAWKQLAELREPAKLRSWLCSITRFLVSKEFRRRGRDPVHAAESLASVAEWPSPEPLPPDHVISEEEKAILWRSLERIPEMYREPLVLFYREHQSIEAVARDLELSEDAVKQRLSRGRKLLQEEVLAFVAGALKQTTPGETFTLGVMAALPLLLTTAKVATAGVAAAEGGAMAKATGLGAILQGILKAVSGLLGVLSPILLLGGYFGLKMGGDARQSAQQRESVAMFWRIMVGCLAAFVVLPMLVLIFLAIIHVDFSGDLRSRLLHGMTIWLGLMYAVVPASLIWWTRQRRRKVPSQPTREPGVVVDTKKKRRFVLWVVIAMIGTACVLVLCLSDSNWKVRHITAAEVQKMVADGKGKEAEFAIMQQQNGVRYFFITVRENGKPAKISAPVDDTTLALLKEQGIKCPTYVQGRDFEVFGWPGRLLFPFCIFILAIGGVVLLCNPGKFNPQETDAQRTGKVRQMERVANKVFGTVVALALIAAAILLGLMTRWGIHHISGAEARQIIAAHGDVQCEVVQFKDGTGRLLITLTGNRRHPNYSAPTDDLTLALLAENKIPYKTYVQGKDFGYRGPKNWMLLTGSVILTVAAVIILWRVVRKDRTLPTRAGSSV